MASISPGVGWFSSSRAVSNIVSIGRPPRFRMFEHVPPIA
jgi:hypothetical protein